MAKVKTPKAKAAKEPKPAEPKPSSVVNERARAVQAAHALFKAITKKAAPHRRLSDPALWSTSAQTIRYSFDWTGFDRADLASIERASGLAQQCLTDFLKIEPRPYAMEVFYRPHPTHEHQVRFTATAYWRQP